MSLTKGYEASKNLYLNSSVRNKVLRFLICVVEKHFVLKTFAASEIILLSVFSLTIFFLNLKKSSSLAEALQLLFFKTAGATFSFCTESEEGISRNFFSSGFTAAGFGFFISAGISILIVSALSSATASINTNPIPVLVELSDFSLTTDFLYSGVLLEPARALSIESCILILSCVSNSSSRFFAAAIESAFIFAASSDS